VTVAADADGGLGWTPVRAGLIADLDEGHYLGN
jgi:hypothetical protein